MIYIAPVAVLKVEKVSRSVYKGTICPDGHYEYAINNFCSFCGKKLIHDIKTEFAFANLKELGIKYKHLHSFFNDESELIVYSEKYIYYSNMIDEIYSDINFIETEELLNKFKNKYEKVFSNRSLIKEFTFKFSVFYD